MSALHERVMRMGIEHRVLNCDLDTLFNLARKQLKEEKKRKINEDLSSYSEWKKTVTFPTFVFLEKNDNLEIVRVPSLNDIIELENIHNVTMATSMPKFQHKN